MRLISLHIFLTLVSISASCQSFCDTLAFIHCEKNKIQFSDSDQAKVYKMLESGNFRILHIGDSHLQAAFLTEKIKQQLHEYFRDDSFLASPGFIFPFSIAQSNNPFFYKVNYTGLWTRTRNVDDIQNVPIGLSGITVSSKSPKAEIGIKIENQKYNYKSKYFFDKATLLHNTDSSITVLANNTLGEQNDLGTTWQFNNLVDSVNFSLTNTDTTKNFNLYGIILEKSNSMVQYHTIGVNGSMAKSYLKCKLFDDHFQILNPNLVIISLGTNEAYSKDFTREDFIFGFTSLISKIHNLNSDALIIITIPNDHYKDGKPNKNLEIVHESIYHLSKYFAFGIWDFYEIMGGEGSISEWHKKQLAADDRLHLNRKGYEIQGELFYNALIDLFYLK